MTIRKPFDVTVKRDDLLGVSPSGYEDLIQQVATALQAACIDAFNNHQILPSSITIRGEIKVSGGVITDEGQSR